MMENNDYMCTLCNQTESLLYIYCLRAISCTRFGRAFISGQIWKQLCQQALRHILVSILVYVWEGRKIQHGGTVWTAVIWASWLHRNNTVLNAEQVPDLIEIRPWKWLKQKTRSFSHSFFKWSSQPLVCLKIIES